MARPRLPKDIQELVHWYERYISPLALIGGVVSDNLILLRRVDLWTTDALFLFYLVVSSGGILLINLLETGRVRTQWLVKISPIIPVIMQFAFGGLFSGFLSLYSRSAAYATSWIFVLIVAALLLGNERFARLYVRVPFQIAIFFLTLFSFLIFFLPVVFHAIGPFMFICAGLLALAIVSLLVSLLMRLVPETRKNLTTIARTIASIYVLFNILYFTGAIPPLPLSLKEAGVYHSVVHDVASGTYTVVGEPLPWYEALVRYNSVFHESPGESVYVYTAVFAPSGLSTQVLDEWQYFDPAKRAWVTEATVAYPIEGGRDGGYEGYSQFLNPAPGAWRVNVVTQFGQLIGQVAFTVVSGAPTALVSSIK